MTAFKAASFASAVREMLDVLGERVYRRRREHGHQALIRSELLRVQRKSANDE